MANVKQPSVGKSSIPDEKELDFILQAQRVYDELGSRKDLSALIDTSPKLLLEKEVELRLHSVRTKLKKCKVYVFDKYLIVASQRLRKKKKTLASGANGESSGMTTASSSDDRVIWFGSKQDSSQNEGPADVESEGTGNKQVEEEGGSEEDSDDEDDYGQHSAIAELEDRENDERKQKRKYNLKMWIDLRKVKPRIKKLPNLFGVTITYVSRIQDEIAPGEYRFDTIVDQAELWMEDYTTATTILGIVQEAVDKNTREALEAMKAPSTVRRSSHVTSGSRPDADSDGASKLSEVSIDKSTKTLRKKNSNSNRISETSTSTGTSEKKKSRTRLKAAKDANKALWNANLNSKGAGGTDHPHLLGVKDIKEKYACFTAVEDEGLTAEYTVSFKNPELGFSLSSSPKIGPFVTRLVKHGLAEICGVTLGDRVTAVNDVEIKDSHGWKQCVDIIHDEKKKEDHLRITFLRKQKTELERIKKEEQLEEAVASNKKSTDTESADTSGESSGTEGCGTVIAIDEEPGSSPSKRLKAQTVELIRKDTSSSKKFTMRRPTEMKKIRKFAKKHEILKASKHEITNVKELNEYKKNNARLLELFDNVGVLFETMFGYLESTQEKTCLHSMKEIYDTEYSYKTELNILRDFQVKLTNKRKSIKCKHLKTGRPFCEHRRPLKLCSQKSSHREPAVAPKDVSSVFLNVRDIIRVNAVLWKQLQEGLGKLYEKLPKNQHVEMYEVLAVVCDAFKMMTPYLQMYWLYCQRCAEATQRQKELFSENEEYREVVSATEKHHKVKLSNLLMKPVQRITRYHLMFSTLQGYVDKYLKVKSAGGEAGEGLTRSKPKLAETTEALLKLAEKVNLRVGEAGNLVQMVEVYSEIGGQDGGIKDLLQPHRRFEEKIELKHYENVGKDEFLEGCYLYLFNDMAAVALCRQVRNPSVFGGASKFSYPIKKFKALSNGNGRNTSISNKKVSNKKVSLKGTTTAVNTQRKSVKRGKKSPSGTSPKQTQNSTDSKGGKKVDFYETQVHTPWKKVGKVSAPRRKKDGEKDLFGVDLYYSAKNKEVTETTQMICWFDNEEQCLKVKDVIEKLIQADKNKREQIEKIRAEKGIKKKGKRKFKKKHDAHKKSSLEKGRNKSKSSMYSKPTAENPG